MHFFADTCDESLKEKLEITMPKLPWSVDYSASPPPTLEISLNNPAQVITVTLAPVLRGALKEISYTVDYKPRNGKTWLPYVADNQQPRVSHYCYFP